MPQLTALREQINTCYRTGEGYDELVSTLNRVRTEAWFQKTSSAAEQILPSLKALFRHGDRITEHFLANWQFDPLPLLANLDIPMLFIFGGQDRVVPAAQMAANLEKLFKPSAKDVAIVTFPSAKHSLMDKSSFFPRLTPGYVDTMTIWLLRRVEVARP